MEKLKLRGELGRVEFDAFAGLSQLEELDLSNCHIKDISMDAFIGCKNLKIINLSQNLISYISPGLFDDQQSLEEIYLDNNQLKTLPKTFFQQKKLLLARLNNNPWICSCDMNNWKAKVTNQEKGPYTQRCVHDFLTGEKISCHGTKSFKFNKKLAPRCDNFKGRSVYYVIRKQMQCSKKYVQMRSLASQKKIPHWLKVEEDKQRANKNSSKISKISNKHIENRVTWQLQRPERRIKNSLKNSNENDLIYQLHKIKSFDGTKQTYNKNEDDLSNDT